MAAPEALWTSYSSGEMPSLSEIAWTWQRRIPTGHVSFVGGSGGIGKSVLVWGLALSVAAGRPFLDAEVDQGTVAYYDFDSEPAAQGHMMNKVRRGLRLAPGDIEGKLVYRVPGTTGAPVLDDARLKTIADEARHGGVALAVIDAWTSSFWNVRSNSTEEVAAKMAELRAVAACGTTVLLIDHAPKPIANGPSALERGLIGSTMKLAGSRAAYLLARVAPKDVDGRDVFAIHCLKNNLGPIAEPLGVERAWTEDAVTFSVTDLPDTESGAHGRLRAQAAIREALDGGDLTGRRDLITIVAQRANVQTRTIEAALARLISDQEVESVPLPSDRRSRAYRLAGVTDGL